MIDIPAIQAALAELKLNGWLLVDFRGSNLLARRVLEFSTDVLASRRLHYYIPAQGTPQKLVHRIETDVLDHLPGEKHVYLEWQVREKLLKQIVGGAKRVAMEYSPRNANPYVARVDAGTVELVREFGCEIVSSGDLIQLFEATWSDAQWQAHLAAEKFTIEAFAVAWQTIARQVREHGQVTETFVQQAIVRHFVEHNLEYDHAPIVAVGPHSGNPHYEPSPTCDGFIRAGDFVLVDLWAKLKTPDGVYSDLTRVGYVGEKTPDKYEEVFEIVALARDSAIGRIQEAMKANEPLQGWQVDDAARQIIREAGYGEFFIHRLGHSIGREMHGNGANMDNLETHDERRVLPRTCFSIEPGIYLPEFGVRSEVNVFIDAQRGVHVTGGPPQRKVVPILAEY